MADNAEFRQRLNSLIADDYLDEDGIADCVARIRQNDGLLRQAQNLLPDDGGQLKDLIDRMWQQSEQQADRLEDKIQRLHTLDQTTQHLYQYQNISTPQPENNINLDSNQNAVMAEFVFDDMSEDEIIRILETRFGMATPDAKEIADSTFNFRKYALKQRGKAGDKLDRLLSSGITYQQALTLMGDDANYLSDKGVFYEYTRLIASAWGDYRKGNWPESAGTSLKDLKKTLKDMGYTAEQTKGFLDAVDDAAKKANSADGDPNEDPGRTDFVHEMGSLACLFNPHPSYRYAIGGLGAPNAMPTWGDDVASGKFGLADWHADMDAINIQQRMKANPNQDPTKIFDDYQATTTDRSRAREFCANYDPTGEGNPQYGLEWLKKFGLNRAEGSLGELHLSQGNPQAGKQPISEEQKQAALDNLTDLLQEQGGIPADKDANPIPSPRK